MGVKKTEVPWLGWPELETVSLGSLALVIRRSVWCGSQLQRGKGGQTPASDPVDHCQVCFESGLQESEIPCLRLSLGLDND